MFFLREIFQDIIILKLMFKKSLSRKIIQTPMFPRFRTSKISIQIHILSRQFQNWMSIKVATRSGKGYPKGEGFGSTIGELRFIFVN